MILAQGGLPPLPGSCSRRWSAGTLAAASANAAQLLYDRDIDAAHAPHRAAARWPRAISTPRGRCVFGLVLGRLSMALARAHGQPARRAARAAPRSCSTWSSTRCCSSAAPRRTSSGAAPPAACRCSSAGPRSPDSLGWTAVGAVRGRSSSGRRRTTGRCRCVPGRLRRGGRADAPGGRERQARSPGRSSLYSWAMVAVLAAAVAGRAHGLVLRRRGARARRRWFLCEAHAPAAPAVRRGPATSPMRLFHGSITYLSLLFLAVAIDPLLPF